MKERNQRKEPWQGPQWVTAPAPYTKVVGVIPGQEQINVFLFSPFSLKRQ